MTNCSSCKYFKLDVVRSKKLGELLGICREFCLGNYIIADFDATECDCFRESKSKAQETLARKILEIAKNK